MKKGEGLLGGGWKRRYFVLRADKLQYFSAETDDALRGTIDLAAGKVSCISRAGISIEGPNVRRRYELEAFSPEDRDRWLAALHAATSTTAHTSSALTSESAAVVSPVSTAALAAPASWGSHCTDRLPSTPTTPGERDRLEGLAELFSIVQTLEHLERVYLRDAVPAKVYAERCQELLTKFKLQLSLVAGDVPSLPQFLDRYMLSAPAAQHRLSVGLTALSEHGIGRDPGTTGVSRKVVFEVGQHFLTLMDSVKLGQRAADQLQPLLADINEGLLRLGQFQLSGRTLLVQWLGRLNGMRASEELTEDESRQLMFDVQKVYDEFHRSLH
eukprot:GGOE01002620.1.p1 GENE.GGOE01002620.1~~GGOE01002620.1.p1  ORF type:complete len:345 (-),score=95.65 GGOE01002620.1:279-1262(-)